MCFKGRWARVPNIGKGIIWLGLMGIMTMAVLLLYVLSASFFPIDPHSLTSLKVLQGCQAVCSFLLPALLVAYLCYEQPWQWLHIDRHPAWQTTLAAVILMLVALPAVNLLAEWNSHLRLPAFLAPVEAMMQEMEQRAARLTEQLLSTQTFGGMMVNMLILAILPALTEELTFRGVLLNLFTAYDQHRPLRRHLAIWAVAVIFSAMHGQFYGFIPRMLLGALFGYMLWWTGSLWTAVWMHLTNNAAAVLSGFLSVRQGIPFNTIETLGTGSTEWIGWSSLCLAMVIIIIGRTGIFLNGNNG